MDLNIGLFNESFPPVMDGVAICVQNYAYWMQKKVGGVSVITPNVPGADYKQYYVAADLFLFPSLYDTNGLVVKEAAALQTDRHTLNDRNFP